MSEILRGQTSSSLDPRAGADPALDPALARFAGALADRYAIQRELGRGGMATVYLARDVRHDRLVALKVLNPELAAVLGAERFLTEIRVTANLQHPHLLPLFDSGESNGLLWYVMPYVEGESLRARLDREKQLPVAEAIRLATAVAQALEYAHGHGVIHRDLKPENILLQAGQPVVADFGIALAVSNAGGQRVTQTGLSLGTPQYMSPEQATGDRAIDARTDIYSLGAVLYEMLAGEPPHAGPTAQSIIAKLMTEEPRPLGERRRSVPASVDAAVRRALEKLPADRFTSATAFADSLAQHGGGAVPADSADRRPANSWRIRLLVMTTIAAVGVATVALATRVRSPMDLQLVRQLTFDGEAVEAAISPDGTWLAYTSSKCTTEYDNDCSEAVEVREVDGAQSVSLGSWAVVSDLEWAHDGRSLVLTARQSASDSGGIWMLNRLGGAARRIPVPARAVTFSVNDASVLMATETSPQRLVRYDATTLAPLDSVPVPSGYTIFSRLEYDRGGGRLLALASDSQGNIGTLLLSSDGKLLDVIRTGVTVAQWAPSGDAVLLYRTTKGAAHDLIRVPVDGNRLRLDRATIALGQVPFSGLDPWFSVADVSGRVALISGTATEELEAHSLTHGGWRKVLSRTGGIAPTDISNGSVLATLADNLGGNVYVIPLDGSPPHAVTAKKGERYGANWSPSRQQLLYFPSEGGKGLGVAIVDTSGGRERIIAPTLTEADWVSESVLITRERDTLRLVDTAGVVRAVIPVPASLAVTSAMAVNLGTQRVLWSSKAAGGLVVLDLRTHRFRVVRSETVFPVQWNGDSAAFAVQDGEHGAPDRLVSVSLRDGTRTSLLDLPPGWQRVLVDRSGSTVVCTPLTAASDVWLAAPGGRP